MIGTGRHASSRLDNQLRGRSGRQGDPGGSVFFASMEDELVDHVRAGRRRAARGRRRRPRRDPGAHWTVGHAQRVAEGANLEIHRNTWRYNKLVEDQRRIVLEHRDRVLRTGAALQALPARCPERYGELQRHGSARRCWPTPPARSSSTTWTGAGRTTWPCWRTSARASTCARSARGTRPARTSSTGRRSAVRAPARGVAERSAETFRTAPITANGADLEAIGLKRPTATWTYLVQDNPFGTDIDRALRRAGRLLRGSRSEGTLGSMLPLLP